MNKKKGQNYCTVKTKKKKIFFQKNVFSKKIVYLKINQNSFNYYNLCVNSKIAKV